MAKTKKKSSPSDSSNPLPDIHTIGDLKAWDKNPRELLAKAQGSHTQEQWNELLLNHPACISCHRNWSNILKPTKDHIVPLAGGGTNDIGNIQPLCGRCNSAKGMRLMHELSKVA